MRSTIGTVSTSQTQQGAHMTAAAITLPHSISNLPYRLDSYVSGLMGLACLTLAQPLTNLIGWELPRELIPALGIFLLPWAGINYLTSLMPVPPRHVVLANIAVDGAWVLGSIWLVLETFPTLSTFGWVLIVAQALGVAGMFITKLAAFKGPAS